MKMEPDTQQPAPVGATRKTIKEAPEGRFPKIVRLTTFLVVVGAVLGFVSYQRARGQLGEAMMSAGSQMMMLAEAEHQDAPRQVVINGQRIHFTSGMAPFAPTEVLDRFEARCEGANAGLMAEFSRIIAEHPDDEGAHRMEEIGAPVLREQHGNTGYVACFDFGDETVGIRGLMERYARFEETRDLHDFGDLRYVYVEPAREDRAHFVAIWTEGTLQLGELFPESGDARGADVAGIPRPPGSRRVITAHETGEDQVATIYQGSDLDQGELESFYLRELPANGWQVLDTHEHEAARRLANEIGPGVAALRGDQMVFLALTTDTDGHGRAAILMTGEEAAEEVESGDGG
jgi:hypothetical protein